MVILTNMTEAQSKTLSKNLNLSKEDALNSTINDKNVVYPVEEIIVDPNLNSNSVVNIDGIMLPVHSKENVLDGNLVPVKSTVSNLRSLALAVASGKFISMYSNNSLSSMVAFD